jgi:hypothetical protein
MSHPPAVPERITDLARIVAGGVIAAAAALYLRAGFSLFIILPVIAGALVPLLRSTRVVALAEGMEAWVRRRQERREEGGVLRTLASPFLVGAVWGMDRTDRVKDDFIRSGIRVGIIALALGALALAAWLVAVAVFYIAIVLFALGILVAMAKESLTGGSSSSGGGSTKAAPAAPRNAAAARLRGKRLVNSGLLVDTSANLRIDEQGWICEDGFFSTRTAYRIDEDGNIIKAGFFNEHTGTRIAPDGRIVRTGILFDESTGTRIKEDGRVVREGLIFDSDAGTRFK